MINYIIQGLNLQDSQSKQRPQTNQNVLETNSKQSVQDIKSKTLKLSKNRYDSIKYNIDGDMIDLEDHEEDDRFNQFIMQDFDSDPHLSIDEQSARLSSNQSLNHGFEEGMYIEDGMIKAQSNLSSFKGVNEEEGNEMKRINQRQQRFKQEYSDQDDEDEEELKEEVGDLPPKIEDLQVEEYDDSDDLYRFGRHFIQNNDEEQDSNNDAPTVVIDENSFCEREIDSPAENQGSKNGNFNIEFALRSIKLQEDEDEAKNKKKKVTILSVEEEEDLVAQINDIRERIKRGETVGQQQKVQYGGVGTSSQFNSVQKSDYEDQYYRSTNLNSKVLDLQSHFRSVDDVHHNMNYNSRQQNTNLDKPQSNSQVPKPPLYSLTFAHPHDPDREIEQNPLAGISQKQAFHSIDQNAPTNCIIMDGPNIFEKKKQRYEKIQRMRGNLNPQGPYSDAIKLKYLLVIFFNLIMFTLSTLKRSRDDITPNGGISSSVSANIPSSQKKSIESSSCKGSSMSMKVNKFQTGLTSQKTKKYKQNKSTVSKIQQTLKPLGQHVQSKSRQVSNIHQVYQNRGQSQGIIMVNGGITQLQSMDDVASSNSQKRTTSKNKSSENPNNQVLLYSLKKGTIASVSGDGSKLNKDTTSIKKKIVKKTQKHMQSMAYHPLQDSHSLTKGGNLIINVGQEPGMAHSSSFKKMKTPKLKITDDLLFTNNIKVQIHLQKLKNYQESIKNLQHFNFKRQQDLMFSIEQLKFINIYIF